MVHAVPRNLQSSGSAANQRCAVVWTSRLWQNNTGPSCCYCLSCHLSVAQLCSAVFPLRRRLREEVIGGMLITYCSVVIQLFFGFVCSKKPFGRYNAGGIICM